MTEAKIFKALGDPLRIRIVTKLSDGFTYTLGDITEGCGISRQAARKQVGVLVDAKIVCLRPEGREVKVSLDMNSIELGKKFIAKLESEWDKRLMKLKGLVEKL
jgi:DNA-binding transcriptional ArsR family regulator